jgi:hypothetical protein
VEALKVAMTETFESVKATLGTQNEKVFQSLFIVRYLISKDPTHIVSAELYSGAGILDNIFYPK